MATNFSLPTIGRPLTTQETGVPDYVKALSAGIDLGAKPQRLTEQLLGQTLLNKINRSKAQYAPEKELADLQHTRAMTSHANLQMQQLQNQLSRAQAFQDLLSGRGAVQPQQQYSQPQSQGMPNIPETNMDYDNGMPAEGPGVAKSASAYDTFPGRRANYKQSLAQGGAVSAPETGGYKESLLPSKEKSNEQVIEQGNPDLYYIDELYDKNPQFKKEFESYNYKKEQQIKYDPTTGIASVTTKYPSGRATIKTLGVGAQPGDIAQSKERGKIQAQTYGKASDSIMALTDIGSNLERLTQGLEQNPDAKNVIGPVNKWLTQVVGNDEDRQYLGEVMSATGNIVLDAAKDIKGAFTGRDQSLVNSLKPNANDPYYMFIGKLKGMTEATELAKQRLTIYADLVDQRIAPHKAIQIASQKTDMSQVENRFKNIMNIAKQRESLKSGNIPSFKSKEEADLFLNQLTPQEKVKLLKMRG